MKSIGLILICVCMGVIGQLFLKQGMLKIGEISFNLNFWQKMFQALTSYFVILGLLCYGLATILWLVVLSKEELSFAYPLISMSYIIIFFSSWLIYKEPLTFLRFAGVLLISGGVYLIYRS